MPPSKSGRKRRPSRSSSSSPRNNDPNQSTETGAVTINSPSHQSQANTPSSTSRSRQLSILQALNASRVKEPKPYNGSFTDEIKALQTVFPPTFEEYQRQYTVFKEQEDIFNYIKRQDDKTYPATVAPLHQEGLSDEDRYVAIDDTVCTVFNFKHQLQYRTPRPPNIQNNERYHYSGEISDALSSIFPGLDLVVLDQEQSVQEEPDTEENDVVEDSETTLGRNTYQAETTHSEFSPNEASSNTTSTRSIARVPRTRAASRKTTPATVTTEEDNETIIPSQSNHNSKVCINDSKKSCSENGSTSTKTTTLTWNTTKCTQYPGQSPTHPGKFAIV